MGSMSWSDDTRCLYCEGRLPLYRKITQGQFCSSAHRKAYWQEQERLAVERLHQSQSTLRAFHPVLAPEVPETHPESVPLPEREPATVVMLAAQELETGPRVDPVLSLEASSYPAPDLDQPPQSANELLPLLASDFRAAGGNSPQMIAVDPFEYEIVLEPLSPTHAVSGPRTNLFPEGSPVAMRTSFLAGATRVSELTASPADAPADADVAVRHPGSQAPAVAMSAAGAVGLPPFALDAGQAAPKQLRVQAMKMEPAPAIAMALDVPLQGDVLLQLLDQQVPHPDRLHALEPFAAHSSAAALAAALPETVEVASETVAPSLPIAAAPVAADFQPAFVDAMQPLAGGTLPAPGAFASRSMIASVSAAPRTAPASMPAVSGAIFEIVPARLQSLSAGVSRPVPGRFALRATNAAALDLSTGVSSDITFPESTPRAGVSMAPAFTRFLPLTFATKRRPGAQASRPEPMVRLLPQAVEIPPVLPHSGLQPLDQKPAGDVLRTPQSRLGTLLHTDGLKKLEPAWAHATGFWHQAPRDLKLLLFTIPALLALVFHPSLPRVAFAAPPAPTGLTGNFRRVLNTEWANVRQTLENRAAVELDEDFRSGLDNWASPEGSTTEWSFDSTGFVRPGPLALYRPSVGLADYQMQFLGLIDKKALSWVVRAADFDNFYVVKLEMVKSGPLPAIALTRYAVINGRAQDRHDVAIPLSVRTDTIYRVRMDVRGSEFTVEVQDQLADSWTETRLPKGGVGFFTADGEASRVRWVQITNQYDMLGRLCAYLAPYDTTNGSWQP